MIRHWDFIWEHPLVGAHKENHDGLASGTYFDWAQHRLEEDQQNMAKLFYLFHSLIEKNFDAI